jgi:hypothetical protein
MHNDSVTATGIVRFELVDAAGKVLRTHTIRNLIVTVGKAHIAARLVGTSQAVMSHLAVGTSANAAVAGDTTLGAELTRVALATYTVAANVVTATATFGAGTGTGTWAEAGLLNAAAAGTMLGHTAFTGFIKAAGDTLNVTWTITIN